MVRFTAVGGDIHHILNPHPETPRKIDSRLHSHDATLPKPFISRQGDMRGPRVSQRRRRGRCRARNNPDIRRFDNIPCGGISSTQPSPLRRLERAARCAASTVSYTVLCSSEQLPIATVRVISECHPSTTALKSMVTKSPAATPCPKAHRAAEPSFRPTPR